MRRHAHIITLLVIFAGLAAAWLGSRSEVAAASSAGTRVLLPMIQSGSIWSPEELDAFALINQQRQANGCGAVSLSRELSMAAKDHSTDMAQNRYFSHTGSDGSTFDRRARARSYSHFPSGEILAGGQNSASEVVRAWMNSSGHRSIILTCSNNDIGIGLYRLPGSPYEFYWTAVFGQR